MGTQDNHSKIPLASIFGKRLDLAFDGGILTSDSGVLLLREWDTAVVLILLSGTHLGQTLPYPVQGRNE